MLGEWSQQVTGATSNISVQKSAFLDTAQDCQAPRPLVEDLNLEGFRSQAFFYTIHIY